jgi:hypothetical protein
LAALGSCSCRLALALAAKVGPGAADAVKAAAVAPGAAAFEVVVLRPALTVHHVVTPDAGARVAYPYAAIFPVYWWPGLVDCTSFKTSKEQLLL